MTTTNIVPLFRTTSSRHAAKAGEVIRTALARRNKDMAELVHTVLHGGEHVIAIDANRLDESVDVVLTIVVQELVGLAVS